MAEIVDGHGRRQAAYPARLEVHVFATLQLQGHLGLGEACDAFVEADRRAERFLHHRMAHQIVGGQRLLDHGQREIFEPVEHLHLAQVEAAFAVDVKRLRGALLADEIDHADVPAGPELSFRRSKPAATAAVIFARKSSIESIWSKVGPTSIAVQKRGQSPLCDDTASGPFRQRGTVPFSASSFRPGVRAAGDFAAGRRGPTRPYRVRTWQTGCRESFPTVSSVRRRWKCSGQPRRAPANREHANAPAAHSAASSGAMPGLASPQPVAPPPCMATITVSSCRAGQAAWMMPCEAASRRGIVQGSRFAWRRVDRDEGFEI